MTANVSSNLASWSTTESSNSPAGTDTSDIDAEFRMIQSVVRKYLATKGADIASASTVDLSSATGNYVHITGVTTITALGTVSAGMRFLLVFDGALTFTHNATSLILPGAANITTAAGDRCEMVSLGSGNWRCLWYQRADGTALISNSSLATKADIQAQTYTAYTTGGISTAYTLTPNPALSALAENQEFDVEFHTAAGSTPTLAISGLTAKSLKYRDDTGALQAVTSTQVPSGWRSRVTYDGTYYIVREVPPVVYTIGVVQAVHAETGAVATGTTAIPDDDTIPQNTEGDEFITLAITPTSASNKLVIEAMLHLSSNGASLAAALFQDSTANALASGAAWLGTAAQIGQVHVRHEMTAGTTSSTTFKIRGGSNGTSHTLNGRSGGRVHGGVMISYLRITEIAV